MNKGSSHTILIKYTQNDNIAATDQDTGWVDMFCNLLKQTLKRELDEPPNFILKPETELITAEEFEKVDIILYILSPAFIFSSNLNQDVTDLEQAFSFDVPLLNKKIKKVLKAPINEEDIPLSISTPNYFYFYQYTDTFEKEYETFEGWNEYADNTAFWNAFSDVISSIKGALTKTEEEKGSQEKIFLSNKNKAYAREREIIKRELKAYGYLIYPDDDYSIEASYMEDPELFYMEKCKLAIHFPDEFIPLTSEERNKSFSKNKEQARFIWFNPEKSLNPDVHKSYTELKVSLKAFNQIEVVESPIEEFKDILKDKLWGRESSDKKLEINQNGKKQYYVISDNSNILEDLSGINELKQVHIQYITENTTVSEYRNKHYNLLRTADSFVIINSRENEKWLRSITNEVMKAPGLYRTKNIESKHILTQSDKEVAPEIARQFQITVVNNMDSVASEIEKLITTNN